MQAIVAPLISGWRATPEATAREVDAARGARTVFTRPQRWVLLAAFALLVVFRLPHAWTDGRFLDEEATVFLAYAWHHPSLDALFRSFGGYLNLGANATTLLVARLVQSGVVPLERAPYLTMTMGLAVQLLPAVLILSGRAAWLASRPAVIAALLIIAIAPMTEEVFLNVLHIQFHLALCVALILALDVPRRRLVRACYGGMLFLAPLCGPLPIVILPLFALRALIDRDRDRLVQLMPLAAGAAVQLLLFYGPNPLRGHLLDPGTIAAIIFVRLIAMPAFGADLAKHIGAAVHYSQVSATSWWWLMAASAVLLFAVLIVLAAMRRDAAIWLILASLSFAGASFGFGMVIVPRPLLFDVMAGERYDFLPLVLLGLTLIVLAMRSKSRGNSVYAGLCLLFLVSGASSYSRPLPALSTGPSWPAEVEAWRRDHRHSLAVWPSPWTADLSDDTRPCSPLGRDLAQSTDPRYCESGWVAGYFRPPK